MSTSIPKDTGHLTPADARAMLRLGNALHEVSPDPEVRKKTLLEGLCRLVGGDSALSVVTTFDRATARKAVVSVVHTGTEFKGVAVKPVLTGRSSEEVARAGREARRTAAKAPSRRDLSPPPPEGGCCVDSFIDLRGMQVVASLTVCRRRGDHRRFTRRHREIVQSVHAEMSWIYGHDLLIVSPEVLALPPRQRETLQHLLGGEGERQIASKLAVSPNTIHHYVKALYRRFGVNTRSALLGKWVRQGEGTAPLAKPRTNGRGAARASHRKA